jgi:hypothetical protein
MFHYAIIEVLGHSMTCKIYQNILHTSCCGTSCVISDIMGTESCIFFTAVFFNIVQYMEELRLLYKYNHSCT